MYRKQIPLLKEKIKLRKELIKLVKQLKKKWITQKEQAKTLCVDPWLITRIVQDTVEIWFSTLKTYISKLKQLWKN